MQEEMSYKKEPYVLSLSDRGYIEGLTHVSNDTQKPLCHFFGGIPYALPPVGPFRFARPRPLPACYRYGTQVNPGRFVGGTAKCPQGGYTQDPPTSTDDWDEDCLQCNIWLPARTPPKEGWPVYFFIHGGWLQISSPNSNNMTEMLGETPCQCIVVMPAYRLNVFGFLASRELEQEAAAKGEPVGNYGFWDQRLALEWTYKNINYFGGDASNITVGGYSAGAHSTFHQLSHDLYLPASKRIIKRAIMHSNGPGMQPKSISEQQLQFDALLTALHIPLSLPAPDKLARLRATRPSALVAAAVSIDLHEFRATSDGTFVRTSLFSDLDSGAYARRLAAAGTQLLVGECADENFLYSSYRQPATDSRAALRARLHADYPAAPADAAVDVYSPHGALPTWKPCGDWREDAHGYVFADLQVHALQRGLVQRLVQGGAGDLVRRYRMEWRAECCDVEFPKEWGVTHSTDMAVWFWGNAMGGKGLTDKEKGLVKAFLRPFWKFLRGDMLAKDWGTDGPLEARRFRSDGRVDIWTDPDWDRGLNVYDVVRTAQTEAGSARNAKL